MSSVLVLGVGPFPTESGAAVSGPTIRLRQFVEPLAAAGHSVTVVMLEGRVREQVELAGVARAVALTPREILEPWTVLKAAGSPVVDAVFGVGSMMPVAAAARLATHLDKPCWIDFFGDPLAEFHAGVSRPGVKMDWVLRDHIWRFVREGLNAGDAFSVVSERQRMALLGQLLLLGRGTQDAKPQAHVATMPCGVPAGWLERAAMPPFPRPLADLGLGPDTRFLVVGGSWTPWLDEVRMGRVLGHMLASEPSLELVVMGGKAEGLGARIRQEFFNALAHEAPAGSVHELGPDDGVAESAVLPYAAATVLLDRDIPESALGSRNRLLGPLRWGLTPVVSCHSELACDLVARGLAMEIGEGNGRRAIGPLRQALLRTEGERRELRRRGLEYLATVSFEATAQSVLAWLDDARRWIAPAGETGHLIPKWREAGM
ncbi:MAG: hypothetical protein KF858_10430 [Candidatus Sumerlaeia bacterium]|nr:hypothetical protein [Candidatus Sumerlaeia bacterium]